MLIKRKQALRKLFLKERRVKSLQFYAYVKNALQC